MIDAKIAALRQDYGSAFLLEKDVDADAIQQFTNWFQQAITAQVSEVNAMSLATIDAHNVAHNRIVLLKSVDANGFVFFTNYGSHKAHEIQANKQVALCFFWKELERQVRIEGTIEKINEEESLAYFQSRPRASQIGAWASTQSDVVANRETIDNNFKSWEDKFTNESLIPKPDNWGGYIVKAQSIEFWQGRTSRLHDRLLYTLQQNEWSISRLMP